MVVGDFNAKVGREAIYQGIIGMYSLHSTSSDNGVRLINFAASSREMVINSTCFQHRRIHKGTWVSETGTVNQIDHVLSDARHASNVMDVRSYHGANIDSDHYLVIGKIRARISITKTTAPPKTKTMTSRHSSQRRKLHPSLRK